MFEPVKLGPEALAAMLQIIWVVSGLFNYVTIGMLWYQANFIRLPDMFAEKPKWFIICSAIGAIAMLFYTISWIGYFISGYIYLAEGIAIGLYIAIIPYLFRYWEAGLLKADKMCDNRDYPLVVSWARLLCGFASVTIFTASSIPRTIIAKSILG